MPPARFPRTRSDLLAPDGAVTAATSTNWAGYVDTAAAPYTTVSASWIQPSITGTTTGSVVIWVGLDGWGGTTVEQCGTQISYNAGLTQTAWAEFYPAYAEEWSTATYPVSAGDHLSATVSWDGTYFNYLVTDATQSWTYTEKHSLTDTEIAQNTVGTPPARSTMEVIVESDVASLINFGSITFTGVTAMSAPIAITMVNANTDATPGALAGNSFTVTWNNFN